MSELELLCQLPDHPLQYDQQFFIKEKWMDRSSAFGLLLSVAEIEPKECPESLKQEVKFVEIKGLVINLLLCIIAGLPRVAKGM